MKKKVNYRGLFFAGITFMGAGVALAMSIGAVGYGLLGVGIAMMAVGIARRSEWDRDQ
jgi:hypothetical protein